MDNNTLQAIKEQSVKLPTEVRNFIASSNWDETLGTILSHSETPEAKHGVFQNEVLLVLIGLVHVNAFRSQLAEQLGEYNVTIDAVADEVDEKIFAPIRPILIEFFENEQAKEIVAKERAELSSPQNEEFVGVESEEHLNPSGDTINPPTSTHTSGYTLTPTPSPYDLQPIPAHIWEKTPDIAPDNLPTGEPESFLPELTPKSPSPPLNPSGHTLAPSPLNPFEEKMKKVFTGSIPTNHELSFTPLEVARAHSEAPPLMVIAPSSTTTQNLQRKTSPQIPPSATASSYVDPYREAI